MDMERGTVLGTLAEWVFRLGGRMRVAFCAFWC